MNIEYRKMIRENHDFDIYRFHEIPPMYPIEGKLYQGSKVHDYVTGD